jgi:hypothetical protein
MRISHPWVICMTSRVRLRRPDTLYVNSTWILGEHPSGHVVMVICDLLVARMLFVIGTVYRILAFFGLTLMNRDKQR